MMSFFVADVSSSPATTTSSFIVSSSVVGVSSTIASSVADVLVPHPVSAVIDIAIVSVSVKNKVFFFIK